MIRSSIATAFLGAWLLSGSAFAGCYQYEPGQVTVRGRIFLRTDFGPPGYGEDPAHDSREGHIYIKLDKELCVEDSADGEAESNVKIMQMVYMIHQPFKRSWIGRHV